MKSNTSPAPDAAVAGVRLTHPERLLYPQAGLTKLDLARYAQDMAAWILPHIERRPLTLVRCPQGADHACFFQKHAQETLPDGIERIAVPDAKQAQTWYMMANSSAALVGLVQISALEWHTWGASAPRLEQPDRIIFDLDPAPDVPWSDTVASARLLRELLRRCGMQSYVKTTGGKGLHLVLPIVPEHGWEAVRAWSRAVAERVEARWPERFVSDMSKSKRDGRIFIDYLRNAIEATAVAPYSPRAKPHAPVSTPLAWEELDASLHPDSLTVLTVRQRMAKRREDPWSGYFTLDQRLDPDRMP
ncbi:non-homologous end-joining DNA ligase [Noviherbaspirillum pedocola]|uniref:Non-homologous end-joining DNA ligase n=1 Tax=Noviherbaspirillum pedocola TaxID=2801341 RepID=A0A934STZ3_9BURK|nr:non-homologous end-joining DNA ligase [Noviherbaspirillum pedocola]MBK4736741.1 non-homologous end-joining DNA ligase [Noviherbaspirillum pedocola]